MQLYGMGGQTDLLPGLIYGTLEHDLCTCSEAAIAVLLGALETRADVCTPILPEARALSASSDEPSTGYASSSKLGRKFRWPWSASCSSWPTVSNLRRRRNGPDCWSADAS